MLPLDGFRMIRHGWLVTLVACTAMLAGCSSTPQVEQVDGAPSEELRNHHIPDIHLNGCQGGLILVRFLDALMDDPAPSPWSGENGAIFYYDFHFYECERVGWGAIERGPVAFILEAEGVAGYPAPCAVPGGPDPDYIHAVYSDDEGFGRQLAAMMFTDFYPSEISKRSASLESGDFGTLSWHPTGYEESTVSFSPTIDKHDETRRTWVFVAPGPNASVRLELDVAATNIGYVDHYGVAELSNPAVLARDSPAFGAVFTELKDLQGVGAITQWSNERCEPSRGFS